MVLPPRRSSGTLFQKPIGHSKTCGGTGARFAENQKNSTDTHIHPRRTRIDPLHRLSLRVTLVYLILIAALLSIAVLTDLRTREIPDWVSVAMLGLAILAAVFGWAGVRWWMVPSGFLVGLLIGVALYRFAHFGGGDAKLIAALGAALGPVALLFVLFWMALAGGILALVAATRGRSDYAYAPAICLGFAGYLVYPAGVFW